MDKKIKFGIFADLHVDIMHDTQERLEVFLDACRKEDVDFVIQLGDFCYPDEDRKCVCSPEKMPINLKLALEGKSYADKEKMTSVIAKLREENGGNRNAGFDFGEGRVNVFPSASGRFRLVAEAVDSETAEEISLRAIDLLNK